MSFTSERNRNACSQACFQPCFSARPSHRPKGAESVVDGADARRRNQKHHIAGHTSMPTQALLFPLIFAIPTACACAFVGPQAGGFLPASSHQTSTWSNLASSPTTAAAAAEEADGVVEGRRSVKDVHTALSNALWNVNYLMDPDFWSASATPDVLQSFHAEMAGSVVTKASTIQAAGQGLFTARDIKAGSIVTLYPIHTVGINLFDGGSEWVALDTDDQDYFMAASEHDEPNYSLFLLGNRPEEAGFDGAMVVDCNPNRPDRAGWMAHRINDGAQILSNDESGVLEYIDQSFKRQNAVIAPWGPSPLLAAFATNDIKEGEEIFTSYGLSYWLDASFPNKDEWVGKTDRIKRQERLLFEQYLYYSQQAGLFSKEANALQTLFDEL